MKTFHRICLRDYPIDETFSLHRGKEYLTSIENENKEVTVFTEHWLSGIPVELFGGEEPGPGETHNKTAVKNNRDAYEEAAGMALENEFFQFNKIDPDAEYQETSEIGKRQALCTGILAECEEYLASNKLNSIGSGSILHQKMKRALGLDDKI